MTIEVVWVWCASAIVALPSALVGAYSSSVFGGNSTPFVIAQTLLALTLAPLHIALGIWHYSYERYFKIRLLVAIEKTLESKSDTDRS